MSEVSVERKLRGILDAMDNRNFKGALKLVNAALAKYPGNVSFRSLKAHALAGVGNVAEATELCEVLLKENTTDEDVLLILSNVFRRTGRRAGATEGFMRACAAAPDNEGLLRSLFAAHIREYNLAAQQQVAMKLHRLGMRQQSSLEGALGSQKQRDYIWWVVTTLLLQATMSDHSENSGGMKRDQLLKLAESMINKQLGGGGLPLSGDPLLLTLIVLQEQGKLQEAIDKVVAAKEVAGNLPQDLLPLQACLMARSGDWEGAAELARQTLEGQTENWGLLQLCLDCYLPSSRPSTGSCAATSFGISQLDTPFSCTTPPQAVNGARHMDKLEKAQEVVDMLLNSISAVPPAAKEAAPTPSCFTKVPAAGSELSWEAGASCLTKEPGDRSQTPGLEASSLTKVPEETSLTKVPEASSSTEGPEASSLTKGPEAVFHATSAEPAHPRHRARLLAPVDLEGRKLLLGEARARPPDAGGVASEPVAGQGPGGNPEGARVGNGATAGDVGRVGNGAGGGNGADADAATRPLAEAVLLYFHQMGHMPCCALDVRRQTAVIRGHQRTWLASEAHAAAVWPPPPLADGASSTAPVNAMRRKVSAFQIENDLGLPEFGSPEEADTHAREVMRVYQDSLPLVASLDEKERGIADELPPLAANALIAGWRLEDGARSPSRLIQAILLLEAAQVRRRVSAPLRFSLVGLYGVLAAADPLVEQFNMLDIKNIMLDSIAGHLLLPVMLAGPHWRDLESIMEHMMDLYLSHAWDWPDSIMMAYNCRNFTKVIEMTKFSRRLEQSYMQATVRSLYGLHRVQDAAGKGPASAQAAAAQVVLEVQGERGDLPSPDERPGAMVFNSDLAVRPAWLPPEDCLLGLAAAAWWDRSEQPEGYGRCWWSQPGACQLPTGSAADYRSSCWRAMQRPWLVVQILKHVLAPAIPTTALQGLIQQLMRASGIGTAIDPHGDKTLPLHQAVVILEYMMFDAAAEMQAMACGRGNAQTLGDQVEDFKKVLETFCGQLTFQVKEDSAAGHGLLFRGAWIVAAHFITDTALWLSLLLQVWTKLLKPPKKSKGKKGQAANQPQEPPKIDANLRSAVGALTQAFHASLTALLASLPAEEGEVSDRFLRWWAQHPSAACAQDLWSWEESLDVDDVLRKVIGSQAEALAVMRTDLARRLADIALVRSL